MGITLVGASFFEVGKPSMESVLSGGHEPEGLGNGGPGLGLVSSSVFRPGLGPCGFISGG